MTTEERITIELATLGRPFQLGMLYDCRNDSLIPGMTLWDMDTLKKDVDLRSQHNTEFQIIASDSIEDKSSALNIEASLKASFLGGLVEVKGSAKYLKDTKSSKHQARVTLHYRTTTKFMQLTMKQLGRGNVQHPYVFDQGTATHVVTAVLYGAQAFFVFDRDVSSGEDHQDIQGNLQVMIKKIPMIAIEGEGSLKMADNEKSSTDQFTCTFYGDVALDNNPVSFQDALKIYSILPKLLGDNGEHAVPMRVWLYPLNKIDSSAAQIVRQISVGLVNHSQNVLEEFSELEMRCNDMLKDKVVFQFPEIRKKIKHFKYMCLEYKLVFQKKLAGMLPSIRGGGQEESRLADILRNKEQSPFKTHFLESWLDCKMREINVLRMYISLMKDIKMLSSKSEHDMAVLDHKAKYVVCFAFTSLCQEETYISDLEPIPLYKCL
ncbi:stonustoxin subunit alpha-like, partial [Acipenser ruthenus]|uniref:stonustoxin subunit alpha-like n=1 Tax=Acipenser ruthenus TaxID=7906 RepID=UPI0027410A31